MKRMVLVAGVVCMGAACVYAVHPGEEGAEKMKQHKQEQAEKRFMAVDTNGDGAISLEEFKAAEGKRDEERKQKMGDKFDPAKEAKRPPLEERFTKLDKDGDGKISKEEFQHPMMNRGGERPGKDKMPKEKPGKEKEKEQKLAEPAAGE